MRSTSSRWPVLVLSLSLAACSSSKGNAPPPAPTPTGGSGGSPTPTGGSGGTVTPPTGEAGSGGTPASGGSGGSPQVPDAASAPAVDAAVVVGPSDAASLPVTDALIAPPITIDPGPPPAAGCTIKWAPNPMVEGERTFEFLEMPDRNTSHPNAVHFSVPADMNVFRIDSHYQLPDAVDWDRQVFTGPRKDDRIRGEVRGMIGPQGELDLVEGQTWHISWGLFIPSTLKGTSRFTHIHQLKFVGKSGDVSGSPIITLSLQNGDGIYLHLWLGGADFPTIPLAGLHDKWLWTDVGFQLKSSGATVHWTLKDGDKVLIDKDQTGNVTWPSDAARARPKWGIYRGIADGIQTTYMMLKDMRAWQCP
jgi:hypothetical protein